jgi:hypothetical protein
MNKRLRKGKDGQVFHFYWNQHMSIKLHAKESHFLKKETHCHQKGCFRLLLLNLAQTVLQEQIYQH